MCGCVSHAPTRDPVCNPRHVPWLGIEPATLWFSGCHSIHRDAPARAPFHSFFLLVIHMEENNKQLHPSDPFLKLYLLVSERERDLLFHLVTPLLVDSVCALIRGNMHSLSLSGLCSNQPRYPAKTILLTLNFLLFSIFQPGSGCGREIISMIFCCQKFYRDSIYSFWINLWVMW